MRSQPSAYEVPRLAEPEGRQPAKRFGIGARKTWLIVAFVAVFLTVGVPRFLAGDNQPARTDTSANFTKICRDHGGTPRTSPASGTTAQPQRFCTIQYGSHVYRMDAITPTGFDVDTAHFQRQGCQQAQAEQSGSGGKRQTFVYHPTSGVCEHRP